jgi:transforming growth factor-beta-induced protein
VTYSNFLTDGQVITSAAGLDVTVRLVDADIYFNDAKVISPNVVTNNGLIHVLDRVMSANGTAPAPGGGGGTTTTGATPTPTNTKPNAGAKAGPTSAAAAGLVVFVACALLVF